MTTAAVATAYLCCSVLAYGITFAFFQDEFPWLKEKDKTKDRIMASVMALMGPIGFVTAVICSRGMRHGWKLW